jgi:hypothetical protein
MAALPPSGGVVVKDDQRLPSLDDRLHSFQIMPDVAPLDPQRHIV